MSVLTLLALALAAPPGLKLEELGGGGKARSFADVADISTEMVPAKA